MCGRCLFPRSFIRASFQYSLLSDTIYHRQCIFFFFLPILSNTYLSMSFLSISLLLSSRLSNNRCSPFPKHSPLLRFHISHGAPCLATIHSHFGFFPCIWLYNIMTFLLPCLFRISCSSSQSLFPLLLVLCCCFPYPLFNFGYSATFGGANSFLFLQVSSLVRAALKAPEFIKGLYSLLHFTILFSSPIYNEQVTSVFFLVQKPFLYTGQSAFTVRCFEKMEQTS